MQGNEKFLRRVASYAHKHALWREGERILAAVSGGPDSLALLLALKLLAVKEKINIGCCCVNHHLRAAAGKEAEFVESVCREWNIPFILKEVDVQSAVRNGGSIETAARDLRYKALREAARGGGYAKIAVAHHGDDQAETVLYHLLRGSGVTGLSGMKPINGDIIRPFLCVSKNEIKDFLKDFSYVPCHDESNDVEDAVRNRIRLSLVPELISYNPRVTESLRRTADIFREEDLFMEEKADVFISSCVEHDNDKCVFFIAYFLALHISLQRRVIRKICCMVAGRIPSFEGTEKFIFLIDAGKTGSVTSSSGTFLEIQYGKAIFYKGSTQNRIPAGKLKNVGTSAAVLSELVKRLIEHLGQWCIEKVILLKQPDFIEKNQIILDADKVGNIVLRYWKAGDRFSPRGINGSKKLARVMRDLHISAGERRIWPLVADENHIYWIAFLRGSNYGLPDKNTKKYLLITLKKENREDEES